MSDTISYSSLYSGCGGLDSGFEAVGFKHVASFDNDAMALETLNRNLGLKTCNADLSNANSEVVAIVAKSDVLIAGPPCQGFSTAGKNDPKDSRNNHLSNVAHIASVARPRIVLIENVKGLLNPNNAEHLDKTISTLKGAGYQVTYGTHSVADYGIAQSRVRVLILAVLSDRPIELALKCEERVSLANALDGIEELPEAKKAILAKSSQDYKIAKRIAPGQKLSNVRRGLSAVHTWDIPEVFGKVSKEEISFLETIVKLRRQNRRRPNGDADPVSVASLHDLFGGRTNGIISRLLNKSYVRYVGEYLDITNTFNGKYRRLQWGNVSPTVDTRFGQHRYFLHPDQHRGFSLREAARIQSFPDTFKFYASETANFRMVGNAVPPKFAQAIASNLMQQWSEL